MQNITKSEIQKQEHLTKERLALLTPTYDFDDYANRPESNLIDLMHWVKEKFGNDIASKDKKSLKCFVHNKIIIDGSFLQFCEDAGITVECLYQDSIASWLQKSKDGIQNEHFIGQGVFLVTCKKTKTKFLHAALFHKGNQNEDEVSFFIITDDANFSKYVDIRNRYEKWSSDREKRQLMIEVIGGDSQPYDRSLKWDDLFLDAEIKSQIRGTVEGFLSAKQIYEDQSIPWKRGILLYGPPGNGKTSTIRTIISNYELKPVTVRGGSSTNDDTIGAAFEYAQDKGPSLLYFEDLDTMLGGNVNLSHFLNLMDGVSSNQGIFVIATANNISLLNQAVINRPSRFDRKWEIPLPDREMSKKYLAKWFGKSISVTELNKILDLTIKNDFSYSYLKELYISSAYEALSNNRKKPTIQDIQKACYQLTNDRKNVENGFEASNTKEIGISND